MVAIGKPTLDKQLAEHGALRELVTRIEQVIDLAPAGPAEDPEHQAQAKRWKGQVAGLLDTLRERLGQHFENEECSPMYTGGADFLRFDSELTTLRAEHPTLLEGLDASREHLRQGDRDAFGEAITAVLADLSQHERAENRILQEALNLDEGGEG